MLARVLSKVELKWKFTVIIDFQFHHLSIVELETFESNNKVIRELLETDTLDC